jgi:hypothetical protein
MNKQNQGGTEVPLVWDALAGLSAAVSQVTLVTASLIPFLNDKELMSKLKDEALVRFNRSASTLERDVREMTLRFNEIYQQHRGRTGGTTDQTEWFKTIQLSEQYVAWAADFDAVVIPTFVDMLHMLQAVGADINTVSIPSASTLAQQL